MWLLLPVLELPPIGPLPQANACSGMNRDIYLFSGFLDHSRILLQTCTELWSRRPGQPQFRDHNMFFLLFTKVLHFVIWPPVINKVHEGRWAQELCDWTNYYTPVKWWNLSEVATCEKAVDSIGLPPPLPSPSPAHTPSPLSNEWHGMLDYRFTIDFLWFMRIVIQEILRSFQL